VRIALTCQDKHINGFSFQRKTVAINHEISKWPWPRRSIGNVRQSSYAQRRFLFQKVSDFPIFDFSFTLPLMSELQNFHMSPQDFRKWGHALVDWIAEYQERVETLPVLAQVEPGQIRRLLPAAPPERGEPFETVMADFNRVIMPGITHWQSPNFFAFFPANASGPSILGELLSAGLGIQGMLWATSPACTELETHVLDWMAEMVGLPDRFRSSGAGGGVIQDSASSALLCALLAARERATGFQTNEQGCNRLLVAYTSPQAHSSVEKAVKVAGLGRRQLRFVEVNSENRMRPDALLEQIKSDRARGLQPFFVSATLGTTSSNAFDPLPQIGRICNEEGLWLHVDGAMFGPAALCPEFRRFQDGIDLADSYAFNPHKWMFTNFDCDCFYVADRATLIKTLSVLPEYLRNQATESGAVIDYRDWQIPLGRRFRALKLWFVIRHYGVEGLRFHIRRHIELAQEFAHWIKASPDFELAAAAPLNLVCFAHRSGDEFNKQLLERLNQSGKVYLTHTVLNNRYVLRFCVGQTNTEASHVRRAWQLIQETATLIKRP
jgi:aromatic-L-amino-acid decarboxylase